MSAAVRAAAWALGVVVALAGACGGARPPAGAAKAERWLAGDAPGVAIVIGPHGAEVRERRVIELPAGDSWLRWDGLPRDIADTAVTIEPVGGAGVQVVARHAGGPAVAGVAGLVGKPVIVRTRGGERRGVLVGADARALALQEAGGDGPSLVPLDEVRGLSGEGETAPGPAFQVRAPRAGTQLFEARYPAPGMRWSAAATLVFDERGERVDVRAEVQLSNRSGASFRGARVALASDGAAAWDEPGSPYTLARAVDLPDGASVTEVLVDARGVPVARARIYDAIGEEGLWRGQDIKRDAEFPATTRREVEAYLEVENVARVGLGLALPAGEVRFFQRVAGGATRFLGVRRVDAVAAGERLRIPMGAEGELEGRRRRVQTDVDDERRRIVEEVEITLVNRGDEARAVTVIERLPRSDWWRLTWWTADVEKDDTRSVRFQVVVPPRGETRLRYRVIYRW